MPPNLFFKTKKQKKKHTSRLKQNTEFGKRKNNINKYLRRRLIKY